jgi:hypothetical protein
MPIALLTLQVSLPGSASLKDKRGRIKPLLARLQREFNVSTAELDWLDARDRAVIGCACLSNDAVHCRQVLHKSLEFTQQNFPDLQVESFSIREML